MPDILSPHLPLALLIVPFLVLVGTATCAAFYQGVARLQETRRLRADPLSVTSYHCRYCHWGMARIEDDRMRFEGDDIVETRRFVCGRCGLPQWVVLRTPILRKVS